MADLDLEGKHLRCSEVGAVGPCLSKGEDTRENVGVAHAVIVGVAAVVAVEGKEEAYFEL